MPLEKNRVRVRVQHSHAYPCGTSLSSVRLSYPYPGRQQSESARSSSAAYIPSKNFPGLFAGHGVFKMSRVGSGRVGSGSVQNLTDRVRSGRVKGFQISRVGSGRVKSFSNLTGRVGSGQEVMKSSRVGSGHDPRETGHSRVGPA